MAVTVRRKVNNAGLESSQKIVFNKWDDIWINSCMIVNPYISFKNNSCTFSYTSIIDSVALTTWMIK